MSYQHWPPTFQQGYFSYPHQSQNHDQPTAQQVHVQMSSPASAEISEEENYTYYIRLIWSKKKSDFVVRLWHDEHCKFKSLADLKLKLMDAFPNDIPTSSDIQLGYFESPGNTKRWIVDKRDLRAMYTTFKPGSKINLWCERGKESSSVENVPPQPPQKKRRTKTEENFEEEDDIFDELRSKHPKMEAPKLRLWTKLIKSGHHDSYVDPPQIPLITGSSVSKPKKESLADAFAGAASAIVKVLHDKPEPPKPAERDPGMSPMKVSQFTTWLFGRLK